MNVRGLWFTLCVMLLGFHLACGRKATEEDCKLMIARNVDIQLRAAGMDKSADFAKRKAEIEQGMHQYIKQCIGRRVTDAVMKCVAHAATAEQMDACFR